MKKITNINTNIHCTSCNELFKQTKLNSFVCNECLCAGNLNYNDSEVKRLVDGIKDSLRLKEVVNITCEVF